MNEDNDRIYTDAPCTCSTEFIGRHEEDDEHEPTCLKIKGPKGQEEADGD